MKRFFLCVCFFFSSFAMRQTVERINWITNSKTPTRHPIIQSQPSFLHTIDRLRDPHSFLRRSLSYLALATLGCARLCVEHSYTNIKNFFLESCWRKKGE